MPNPTDDEMSELTDIAVAVRVCMNEGTLTAAEGYAIFDEAVAVILHTPAAETRRGDIDS